MKARRNSATEGFKPAATQRFCEQWLLGSAIFAVWMALASNVISQDLPLLKAQSQVARGTKINDSNPARSPLATNTTAQEHFTNAVLGSIGESTTKPDLITKDGFVDTGFERLSGFPLMLSNHLWDTTKSLSVLIVAGEIPEAVKSLDKRRVAVKGFMLPVKLEAGRATEFMLLKNQMVCCFGGMPQINDWVYVRMGAPGVKITMDQPLKAYGTFHIGEFRHSNGVQFGIYQLDGEKLELPENPK